jgi:ribonuclease PH
MSGYIRSDGRQPGQLRPIRFVPGIAPHATGSVLVEWGNTRVICAVTMEESVPKWMQSQKVPGGWLTAEYSMLPYSTLDRKPRDISKLKLDGRSQEIQRLIGRSLRAGVDLVALGARTAWVDCDVLQADGGTRTAAISGAYVALAHAIRRLQSEGKLSSNPLKGPVAAVSLGVVEGLPLLDLAYVEDKDASVDLNLVMDAGGRFIELQASGEEATFSGGDLEAMLALGRDGVGRILELQRVAISGGQP